MHSGVGKRVGVKAFTWHYTQSVMLITGCPRAVIVSCIRIVKLREIHHKEDFLYAEGLACVWSALEIVRYLLAHENYLRA